MTLFSFSASAQAGAEALLFDRSMEPTPVVLLELDTEAGRIVYFDRAGARTEAGLGGVVRLTFPAEAISDDTPRPVLMTTDGQRVVGRAGLHLHGTLERDDTVAWRDADGFPAFGVSLDDLAWAVMSPGIVSPPAEQPTDDVLVLPNGERLVGFVEALAMQEVRFVIGDADDAVAIRSSRIAGLFIANPMAGPDAAAGVTATLRSGSRWRCAVGRVEAADGEASFGVTGPMQLQAGGNADGPVLTPVRFGDADRPGQADLPVVTRIDLSGGGVSLLPLSALAMSVQRGGEVFGEPMPPRVLPGGSIALHAPVGVAFALPRGAERLVATVALAIGEDIPAERHAWAGCEVVVRLGEAELARVAVDAEHPERRINVSLPEPGSGRGRALSVIVEEGVNGPVLDRVELRDAELLVVE